MKKFLALLLAFTLIFVLCACGNETTSSDPSSSKPAQSGTVDFVKPENYASVVLVTINPQFRLYLDVAGEVLAVEPVNDDAKSIAKSITAKTGNIETVIENIVTATDNGGFVKGAVTVNFEITEIKDTQVNTETILNKAKTSADNSFKELNVEAEIKTSVSENANNTASSDSTSNDTATTESNSSLTNTASQPTHTHSYSAATCLKPATCSCGATGGPALGHSYKNGVCSRCNAKDPNVSYTAVTKKNGKWSLKYASGDTLYNVTLKLYGSSDDLGVSVGLGDPFSTLPEDFQEDVRAEGGDYYVVLDGKEYYIGRGDGDALGSVTESRTTVTVTDASGNKLVLERTGENSLTVKTSPEDFSVIKKVPVGTVITFTAS